MTQTKSKAHIFWILLGIFATAIFSAAVDVGDKSDCASGQIIKTNGSLIWVCADDLQHNLSGEVWMLDGSTAPPTADWDMGEYSFTNTSGIYFPIVDKVFYDAGGLNLGYPDSPMTLNYTNDGAAYQFYSPGLITFVGGFEFDDANGVTFFKSAVTNYGLTLVNGNFTLEDRHTLFGDPTGQIYFNMDVANYSYHLRAPGGINFEANSAFLNDSLICTEDNSLCASPASDIWVNETGDTMTGALHVLNNVHISNSTYVNDTVVLDTLNFSEQIIMKENFYTNTPWQQIYIDLKNYYNASALLELGVIDVRYQEEKEIHNQIIDYAQIMNFMYGGTPWYNDSNTIPIIFNLDFNNYKPLLTATGVAQPKAIRITGEIGLDGSSTSDSEFNPTILEIHTDLDLVAPIVDTVVELRYIDVQSTLYGNFAGSFGYSDADITFLDFRPTYQGTQSDVTIIKYAPQGSGIVSGNEMIINSTRGDVVLENGNLRASCIESDLIESWADNSAPSWGSYATKNGGIEQDSDYGTNVPFDVFVTGFVAQSDGGCNCTAQHPYNVTLVNSSRFGGDIDIAQLKMNSLDINYTYNLSIPIERGQQLKIRLDRANAAACVPGEDVCDDMTFQAILKKRCFYPDAPPGAD